MATSTQAITIQNLDGYDSSNPFAGTYLATTNWYYPSGDPNFNKLRRVDHPDQTMELYEYTANSTNQTNIVYSGQANSGRTVVVAGTKTTTVIGLAGQTLSRQVADIATGYITSRETYSSFDSQGRAGTVSYLDGTSNHSRLQLFAILIP